MPLPRLLSSSMRAADQLASFCSTDLPVLSVDRFVNLSVAATDSTAEVKHRVPALAVPDTITTSIHSTDIEHVVVGEHRAVIPEKTNSPTFGRCGQLGLSPRTRFRTQGRSAARYSHHEGVPSPPIVSRHGAESPLGSSDCRARPPSRSVACSAGLMPVKAIAPQPTSRANLFDYLVH